MKETIVAYNCWMLTKYYMIEKYRNSMNYKKYYGNEEKVEQRKIFSSIWSTVLFIRSHAALDFGNVVNRCVYHWKDTRWHLVEKLHLHSSPIDPSFSSPQNLFQDLNCSSSRLIRIYLVSRRMNLSYTREQPCDSFT